MNGLFWLPLLAGAAAGVLSGMGVGGGTLLMVWLTVVAGFSPAEAAGYNLLYFLCCAPVALLQHIRHRLVNETATLWSLAGGLPACLLAWRVAELLDTVWLRRGFGLLLLAVGLREVLARADQPARLE